MLNKNWSFLHFQKEFSNFSFCICKLAVTFYMINENKPKRKFWNIVQCPFNFVISTGSQKGISKKGTVFFENVRFCSELLTKILFVNCWAALLHDKALQGRQRSIIYVQIGRPQCKPSLLFWVILAWSESIHRSFMTWSSRSHWAIVMLMATMYWQDIMNRC